jgi:hypothetical protein
MNKPRPGNSVNVSIAIHIPNSLKTNGLTLNGDQGTAELDYRYESHGSTLDPAKFKDVVEISLKARKLASKRNKR